mmetsp:Transcript_34101/g.82597  ORF Transcript_34101/g.82597 Transcript_34101/m.82597 type:complete len:166 (+) Transcript_34101:292-789(+)
MTECIFWNIKNICNGYCGVSETPDSTEKRVLSYILRNCGSVPPGFDHLKTGENVSDSSGMRYMVWKRLVKKTKESDKTAGHLFSRQLRLIKGNSAQKVKGILQKYRTAKQLIIAYSCCDNEEEEKRLLVDIRWGTRNAKIGPAQSEKVWAFFRENRYDDETDMVE